MEKTKTVTTEISEVYVLIIEDRHSDTDVEVFYVEEQAVCRARELAQEYCGAPEDYEEHKTADWCFHATYSCEGDNVRVLRKDIE